MNAHLTPDELVDALDESLAAARRAHLASCAACQAQVDELTATLGAARAAEVPEPSPLFFERFTERVQALIASDPPPLRVRRLRWFQWPVLVPMGSLALLVLALIGSLPADTKSGASSTASAIDITTVDPATAADDGWMVLSELLADVDLETVRAAGVAAAPGSAERAAASLSDEEREELVRLLEEELKESGG